MRINSNSYTDSLILRYSRTLQAMNADMSGRFDAVLSEANKKTMVIGSDTLISEAAQRYAKAMDVSGKHDTVFAAPA